MKRLFILNDPPYGTKRSYNGPHLAGALAEREGVAAASHKSSMDGLTGRTTRADRVIVP